MNAPAVSAAVLFEDSGHLKADDKDGQSKSTGETDGKKVNKQIHDSARHYL